MALPEGSQVRVVVKSAKLTDPIQATGTIIRVETEDRQGLAVEFTSISSHSREVIQNCVCFPGPAPEVAPECDEEIVEPSRVLVLGPGDDWSQFRAARRSCIRAG